MGHLLQKFTGLPTLLLNKRLGAYVASSAIQPLNQVPSFNLKLYHNLLSV